MVILSEDPYNPANENICDLFVLETILGGKSVGKNHGGPEKNGTQIKADERRSLIPDHFSS